MCVIINFYYFHNLALRIIMLMVCVILRQSKAPWCGSM